MKGERGENLRLKSLRQIICLLLIFCLSTNMLPIQVLAEETDESPPGESSCDIAEAETPETTEVPLEEETEPEEELYNAQSCSMSFGTEESYLFLDVPKYYQDDYPDTPYGNGTVATSGCTIVCLAMAASYLQGREYAPDRLAEQYQSAGTDNLERMEAAADGLGLVYEKAYDWGSVQAALKRHKIVIALVEAPSPFTDSGHTLVLTGLTPVGDVLVNDPNRSNYEDEALKQGYEQGFRQEQLEEGFAGCWIFEDTETAKQARAAKAEQKLPEAPRAHRRLKLDAVPLYLQTDYPNVRYNDGTIATSGCTLTCLAMVASYLRQEEILPDELVERFGTYESSNIQRMEAASIVLDLPFEKTMSWWETKEALKQGKIAIILLEPESDLTSIQHTIVATGLTPEGLTRIHDPNGKSYKKSALKEGFAEGFDDNMMLKGFSGAWIYDRYDPPEPRESRYPDFGLTDEELHMIASIVWLESRGEPFEGQRAVAEVIFNRLASGKFSKTVRGTILAEGQFRTAKFLEDAEPGELQYKAIEMALSGHNVLPKDVYFFGRKAANKNVWGQIGKHIFCKSY